jgi:hypothetical protein
MLENILKTLWHRYLGLAFLFVLLMKGPAGAQAAPEPPPLWDAQVGASFVGTSGNSETTTTGLGARARAALDARPWENRDGRAHARLAWSCIETAELRRYSRSPRGQT